MYDSSISSFPTFVPACSGSYHPKSAGILTDPAGHRRLRRGIPPGVRLLGRLLAWLLQCQVSSLNATKPNWLMGWPG